MCTNAVRSSVWPCIQSYIHALNARIPYSHDVRAFISFYQHYSFQLSGRTKLHSLPPYMKYMEILPCSNTSLTAFRLPI